jgi:hypothetical protein
MKAKTYALSTCVLALLSAPAIAAEGMWMPHQTGGIANELRAQGLQLDPALLGNLKAAPLTAIASLGGCSAAFLSPQGLVATNHHCVYGSIQYNSKPGQDYLTDGFVAASLTDELPACSRQPHLRDRGSARCHHGHEQGRDREAFGPAALREDGCQSQGADRRLREAGEPPLRRARLLWRRAILAAAAA